MTAEQLRNVVRKDSDAKDRNFEEEILRRNVHMMNIQWASRRGGAEEQR